MEDKPRITPVEPTRKEAEERVRDTFEQEQDIFRVKGKNPSKEYRWVNTRKENLAFKLARGWKVTDDPNIKTMSKQAGGPHKVNEMVLAEMDKERYDRLMKGKREVGEARRRKAGDEFREEAHRHGVKTFDERR